MLSVALGQSSGWASVFTPTATWAEYPGYIGRYLSGWTDWTRHTTAMSGGNHWSSVVPYYIDQGGYGSLCRMNSARTEFILAYWLGGTYVIYSTASGNLASIAGAQGYFALHCTGTSIQIKDGSDNVILSAVSSDYLTNPYVGMAVYSNGAGAAYINQFYADDLVAPGGSVDRNSPIIRNIVGCAA